MEKRKFGATDMEVSVLGFGGSEIGYESVTASVVGRILNGALEAGPLPEELFEKIRARWREVADKSWAGAI